ncbi:MAG: hypothetical protein AVDCRST_MAG56-6068 [uncultured Cytophagales bacterium]|uniref:Lipocalin-like domain-containing protein n=1 Tax=uncultured Cytophagales bacterium TaxID=158755 RepID=A0A6J4KL34_9SPHI|nr:MAG: hypothetical protein AVDCRST_MAG56-6068 [uncultured Cytophagales bacterium]
MAMRKRRIGFLSAALFLGAALFPACQSKKPGQETAPAGAKNQVLGIWKPLSAQIDPEGRNVPAYGPNPAGRLVFTENMQYLEVLHDPGIPAFKSDVRGQGTPEENQAAMAGSIAFYGQYTVDERGEFNGNRVDGSTFPNWIGSVRTRADLKLVVTGDTMTENFQRPDGTEIRIVWARVR